MNILVIASAFPCPATDGWRIRVLSLLQALARQHRLTLCSFVSREPDPRAMEAAREWFHAIHVVSRDPRYGALNLLRGAVGPTPFPVLNYHSTKMAALVQRVTAAERFDALHVEDIHMAQYAIRREGVRTVLDLHNVESSLMRRFARHQGNPFTRLYALLTARKFTRYEARIISTFDRVLTCSEDDRALLAANGARAEMVVVPNGVDTTHFAPSSSPSSQGRIVFVGRMDYAPNVDAVLFFCRSILPLVQAARANVTFTVVGQNPPRSIRALASTPGVTITGYVDDVRPYLADATVVVVPLRFGSGTRLKILEAMAMGKAVVSTTIGSEGVRAVPGVEILLADEAPAFSAAVARLLDDPVGGRALGHRARQRVVSEYSWTRIGKGLLAVYDGLPKRPGKRPSRSGRRASVPVQPRTYTSEVP